MNSLPVFLFRSSLAESSEEEICRKYFEVYNSRSRLPKGSLVFGRYSVLPYYDELCDDLAENSSVLINSRWSHQYLATIKEWYPTLFGMTPRTYLSLEEFKNQVKVDPTLASKSFVLKGETNSKKHNWDTHMFAKTLTDVDQVYRNLSNDGLVGAQSIIVREFVPLRSFGKGIKGLPITEEYRFFVLYGKVVGSGYYWSEHPEVREEYFLSPNNVDKFFLQNVIDRVSPHVNFFVVDIARTESGNWIVVELNEAQMSGLSDIEPEELYFNMSKMFSKEGIL